MRREDRPLFSTSPFKNERNSREAELYEEIDNLTDIQLLKTSIVDLSEYFKGKYSIESAELRASDIQTTHGETPIDISGDPGYIRSGEYGSRIVQADEVTYHIPFTGNRDVFKYRPTTLSSSGPYGCVVDGELLLSFSAPELDQNILEREFDSELRKITQYLGLLKTEINNWNESLEKVIMNRIQARKDKVLKRKDLAASLKYPMKRDPDAPNTYALPIVRKKRPVKMPKPSTGPYNPEPVVDMEEYEFILSIITNMVLVMEKSPSAFADMKEEVLRFHFLVQLNGQYEGRATGETFNYNGDTDIIIKEGNRNVFIAECKFWDGPKSLSNAIDQLLRYACWRDTKLAIIIFNRDTEFSTVLEKIPDVVSQHSNYKHKLDYNSETGFRYVVSQRDDKNRDMILTVLAFNIPKRKQHVARKSFSGV